MKTRSSLKISDQNYNQIKEIVANYKPSKGLKTFEKAEVCEYRTQLPVEEFGVTTAFAAHPIKVPQGYYDVLRARDDVANLWLVYFEQRHTLCVVLTDREACAALVKDGITVDGETLRFAKHKHAAKKLASAVTARDFDGIETVLQSFNRYATTHWKMDFDPEPSAGVYAQQEGNVFLNESSVSILSACDALTQELAEAIVSERFGAPFVHWDELQERVPGVDDGVVRHLQSDGVALTSLKAYRLADRRNVIRFRNLDGGTVNYRRSEASEDPRTNLTNRIYMQEQGLVPKPLNICSLLERFDGMDEDYDMNAASDADSDDIRNKLPLCAEPLTSVDDVKAGYEHLSAEGKPIAGTDRVECNANPIANNLTAYASATDGICKVFVYFVNQGQVKSRHVGTGQVGVRRSSTGERHVVVYTAAHVVSQQGYDEVRAFVWPLYYGEMMTQSDRLPDTPDEFHATYVASLEGHERNMAFAVTRICTSKEFGFLQQLGARTIWANGFDYAMGFLAADSGAHPGIVADGGFKFEKRLSSDFSGESATLNYRGYGEGLPRDTSKLPIDSDEQGKFKWQCQFPTGQSGKVRAVHCSEAMGRKTVTLAISSFAQGGHSGSFYYSNRRRRDVVGIHVSKWVCNDDHGIECRRMSYAAGVSEAMLSDFEKWIEEGVARAPRRILPSPKKTARAARAQLRLKQKKLLRTPPKSCPMASPKAKK